MNKSQLIFTIIILFFLSGCAATNSSQEQTTATPAALSPTPTKKITVTQTKTPRPVLPPIRTPELREALPAEGVIEFHILHWNDFHGELVEYINEENIWVPGAARLAAFVKSEKAKYDPDQVLILDAGDWFEGSIFARPTRGGKVLDFYKQLGVDAITVGNHEFFLGVPRFYEVVSQAAPIEIVSANLRKASVVEKTCTDKRILSPYKIFELGTAQNSTTVRIAVIGVSAHYLEYEARSPISGVCFPKPEEAIINIYDQLMETEHPDVLIVLSHSGLNSDLQLAEKLNAAGKPVDIIIGGHSHSWIDAPEKIGNTIIVTAGERGRAVGILDLIYNRATAKLDVKWRQEVFSFCSPEDPETLAFLQDTIPAGSPKKPCLTIPKNPAYDYLIDMPSISESIGYWTLGKGKFPATDSGMIMDQIISSHGTEYTYGLFAHAPSELKFALDEKYVSFATEISVKETACSDGAAFTVSVDNQEIYNSGNLLPSDEFIPLTLDVSGGKILKLVTLSEGDMSCDWTIWGDPYLVKK